MKASSQSHRPTNHRITTRAKAMATRGSGSAASCFLGSPLSWPKLLASILLVSLLLLQPATTSKERRHQHQQQRNSALAEAKSLHKRSFSGLGCLGVYDKAKFARLDRICEECYQMYREPEIHQTCRWVQLANPHFGIHILTSSHPRILAFSHPRILTTRSLTHRGFVTKSDTPIDPIAPAAASLVTSARHWQARLFPEQGLQSLRQRPPPEHGGEAHHRHGWRNVRQVTPPDSQSYSINQPIERASRCDARR